VNDERIERYLAGEMTESERTEFEREIMEDPKLSELVYADAQIQAALETAAEEKKRESRPASAREPRRWWRLPALRWGVPVAVAAAILAVFVVVDRSPGPPPKEVFRGGESGFAAISPQGDLGETPARFVWTPYPGAAHYRFELFDAASTLVHTTVTADTTTRVSVAGAAARQGYWMVTPLDENLSTIGQTLLTRYRVTAR
jgi:hypothetical protein